VDDIIAIAREKSLKVMCITETWHDADSVCIGRLRDEGYTVVEKARPRRKHDMFPNHGGVLVAASPGLRLNAVNLGATPTSFEYVCTRVKDKTSMTLLLVYRPGSASVSSEFFTELGDMLERISTFSESVIILGDFNVRLDHPDDPNSKRLMELLATHGFVNRVTSPTHNLGGTLDIVATRQDQSIPPLGDIHVEDVHLSDHYLITCGFPSRRPPPIYKMVTRRIWRNFDDENFGAELAASPLCNSSTWYALSVDDLAEMYDSQLKELLGRMVPERTIRIRQRPSDVWFDNDCRSAKNDLRKLERDLKSATGPSVEQQKQLLSSHRCAYRRLLRSRKRQYWRAKMEEEMKTPRMMWQSVDQLRGKVGKTTPAEISANQFHAFFDEKVSSVRQRTSAAPLPSFTPAMDGCRLDAFMELSVAEVTEATLKLPNKQCAYDPIPTWLLKKHIGLLAPFLTSLYNRSLTSGVVPQLYKTSYVTPIVKKSDMDPRDVKSYRPISNLRVVSKLLERLVAIRMNQHISLNNLLPICQSAYRANHSTETAVLQVGSDLLQAVDTGDIGVLVLLDLSAAFDTVDHSILLERLATSCGLANSVLDWFTSYLSGRTQHVAYNDSSSEPKVVTCGVPQGSVLGPMLFTLYIADFPSVIARHGLNAHLYADDSQAYGHCKVADIGLLQERVSVCLDEVSQWMTSNRLQLNADKTEIMWISSSRKQHLIPSIPFRIGECYVMPVKSVRDLGIHWDSDTLMRTHIDRTLSSCFGTLRTLRTITDSIPNGVLRTLVSSLVLSRVDYGNAALYGLPAAHIERLQAVLNAAARLIFGARGRDHISPLLKELHWLRIRERIDFKIACLTWRCLNGSAPAYLSSALQRVSDQGQRPRLRSADSLDLIRPRTRNVTHGDRAWPAAAATVWNSLMPSLKRETNYLSFRRGLKSCLWHYSFI